ncbi:hypothetical protein HOD05_00830 [Candidatus Woesearchaeota archaeon]|jgi:hypothetical protein|nr:hypothetical protein [Candidatus Woesearchaeota archaeon]MBT4150951.1 hypothetical protein [Candidatus Woesearchaeota archaeon]MBT4247324.1 hypothetical protein [Candidatus Woesearchaeota archaeon]MBT4433741.1 hypothetical protein [Candidatus Woesearchaeota archaeon]
MLENTINGLKESYDSLKKGTTPMILGFSLMVGQLYGCGANIHHLNTKTNIAYICNSETIYSTDHPCKTVVEVFNKKQALEMARIATYNQPEEKESYDPFLDDNVEKNAFLNNSNGTTSCFPKSSGSGSSGSKSSSYSPKVTTIIRPQRNFSPIPANFKAKYRPRGK